VLFQTSELDLRGLLCGRGRQGREDRKGTKGGTMGIIPLPPIHGFATVCKCIYVNLATNRQPDVCRRSVTVTGRPSSNER